MLLLHLMTFNQEQGELKSKTLDEKKINIYIAVVVQYNLHAGKWKLGFYELQKALKVS